VSRLKARKIDARVVGAVKPYRVRVGRYDTRAAATAAASKLKAQKIDAFVTELGGVEK
jgi:cell division protein FtsN